MVSVNNNLQCSHSVDNIRRSNFYGKLSLRSCKNSHEAPFRRLTLITSVTHRQTDRQNRMRSGTLRSSDGTARQTDPSDQSNLRAGATRKSIPGEVSSHGWKIITLNSFSISLRSRLPYEESRPLWQIHPSARDTLPPCKT